MKIDRSDDRAWNSPPESNFSGDIRIGGYFRYDNPSRLAGATVQFAPGARTPWKVNPMGQTIVILSGQGLIQTEGQAVVQVCQGDIVRFAPMERHWEGASLKEPMRYLAFQEESEGLMVSFGAAVTDEEYASAEE